MGRRLFLMRMMRMMRLMLLHYHRVVVCVSIVY